MRLPSVVTVIRQGLELASTRDAAALENIEHDSEQVVLCGAPHLEANPLASIIDNIGPYLYKGRLI